MICSKCKNKMLRDHVKDNVDYFVCVNGNCEEYGKVTSGSGESSNMEIKQPESIK